MQVPFPVVQLLILPNHRSLINKPFVVIFNNKLSFRKTYIFYHHLVLFKWCKQLMIFINLYESKTLIIIQRRKLHQGPGVSQQQR